MIVGNVLTAPEWRRTQHTNALVANFRVASTSRRFDRDNNRWVDGDSLRVRVNCWRRLAEGVAASITVGDPVVVVGRLYTRDWTDNENNQRTSYEMEAVAVGHDLARGKGQVLPQPPVAADQRGGGPGGGGPGARRGRRRWCPRTRCPSGTATASRTTEPPTFGDVPPGVTGGAAATLPEGLDPVVALAALDPDAPPESVRRGQVRGRRRRSRSRSSRPATRPARAAPGAATGGSPCPPDRP